MHLSEQEISFYLLGDESDPEVLRIATHLVACPACQEKADKLTPSGVQVLEHLSVLGPGSEEAAQPAHLAFAEFKQKYSNKERTNMFERIFNHKYRFAWVAFTVVAFIAISMLFPQVRAIGSSFLGLFRVEQFTIIQVDPENIEEQLGSSSNFEYLLAEDVQVEKFGEMQEVDSREEAASLAGFDIRLPRGATGETQLLVQPGAKVSLLVDMKKVQALLDELGISDLNLPSNLDGAEVSMELPVAVGASFGNCILSPEMVREAEADPDGAFPDLSQCVTLTQFPSPEISAPPGLDIASIGQAFLQVLGMTPEDALQFSQTVDWSTTLVVPIPRYGTDYQDVMVDGVKGTLIMQSAESEFPRYMLVWIRDGIVYALTGPGDAQSAVDLANSID